MGRFNSDGGEDLASLKSVRVQLKEGSFRYKLQRYRNTAPLFLGIQANEPALHKFHQMFLFTLRLDTSCVASKDKSVACSLVYLKPHCDNQSLRSHAHLGFSNIPRVS